MNNKTPLPRISRFSQIGLISLLLLTPPIFADSPILSGKAIQQMAESKTQKIDTLSLKGMLEAEPDMVLIDIRTPDQISLMGGQIDAPQNVNISRGMLEFKVQRIALEKDTPIVVYCGVGIRSPLAAETLQNMGYTNVKNYADGFIGWEKSGGAVTP